MNNKDELDPVWDAVLARLEREGFTASDILQSMLQASAAGLVDRCGYQEAAALTVSTLRKLQPSEATAA